MNILKRSVTNKYKINQQSESIKKIDNHKVKVHIKAKRNYFNKVELYEFINRIIIRNS